MRRVLFALCLCLGSAVHGQIIVEGESIECFGGRLHLLENEDIFAFDLAKVQDLDAVIQQIKSYQGEDDPGGQKIDEYYARLGRLVKNSEKLQTTKTGKLGRFTLRIEKPVQDLLLVAYSVSPEESYEVSFSSVYAKINGASRVMVVLGWEDGDCMVVQRVRPR